MTNVTGVNVATAIAGFPASLRSDASSAGVDSQDAKRDSTQTSNSMTAQASGTAKDKQLVDGLSEQEIEQVRELAARDREVRAHEQAHASVGGRYASAPSYTFQRGPDGRQYAVGGEVAIDISPVAGDPEATIAKAQIVRRAALAPAEPSAQDRSVAAEATAIEQQARVELIALEQEEGGIGATSTVYEYIRQQTADQADSQSIDNSQSRLNVFV